MSTNSIGHTLTLIAVGAMLVTSTPLCASEMDARIESAFSKSYTSQSHLKNNAIKTVSTNGVVTISGIATNVAEKALVTKLATDISGVKSVVNNMTIAPAVSAGGVKPARPQNLRLVGTRD